MKYSVLILFLAALHTVSAQLPNRAERMVGTWEYREGSGYESWEMKGEVLIGESFRISKLGDTIIAEQMEMQLVNKTLLLEVDAFVVVADTLQIRERSFVGGRRKLEFVGMDNVGPIVITYKTRWLFKNKMVLFIGTKDDPKDRKLTLIRQE